MMNDKTIRRLLWVNALIMLTLLICTVLPHAAVAAAPATPIKYAVVDTGNSSDGAQQVCNIYGADGWQLVAVFGSHLIFSKR